MKKVVLFLIVFSLLCVPLISASERDCSQFSDPIMKNDSIELTQVCTTCSYVNLTYITISNGTSIPYNSAMSKSDIHFSYTYSPQLEG